MNKETEMNQLEHKLLNEAARWRKADMAAAAVFVTGVLTGFTLLGYGLATKSKDVLQAGTYVLIGSGGLFGGYRLLSGNTKNPHRMSDQD
ncbi:MAG TPA: hypothetical protein VLJ21_01990 [Candidatus Binatia bacterium]|nr:hypothetical protein [Candidatus Binatia bacterium]